MAQWPTIIAAIVLLGSAAFFWYRAKGGMPKMFGGGVSILQAHTRDLTADAAKNALDPVIGRDAEIERVIHILSRRRKNNPLLIGEPGVGKTAIVEGLAQYISKGSTPSSLRKKRVLVLDLPGLISGTKYRGEFEERMHKLTDEITALGRTIILFIDEIHTLEQSSGAEGAMNASDILKPALARGDLQTIGSTTWHEYERFIKPDDALNRRFQPLLVGEPSKQDALKILQGLKKVYEDFHHVAIDDAALDAAIASSAKIKDRFLPDKAIDLIDEACAKVAIDATGGHAVTLGVLDAAAKKATAARASEGTPTVTVHDIDEVVAGWLNQ